MPSRQMVTLPIPEPRDGTAYSEIFTPNGEPLDKIISSLAGKNFKVQGKHADFSLNSKAHLDPDLRAGSIKQRDHGWLPVLGQCKAAQGHLAKQGVQKGDVFIFWGWFHEVEARADGKWQYRPDTEGFHAIFGWLQVGEIYPISKGSTPNWARNHHHVAHRAAYPKNNTLYVAEKTLNLTGADSATPGAGSFSTYCDALRLTSNLPHNQNRSLWKLPAWFYRKGKQPTLSYHSNKDRWTTRGENVELQTVYRGQEFVFDCGEDSEPKAWLVGIIQKAKQGCTNVTG